MEEIIKKIVKGALKFNDALTIFKSSQEQIDLVNKNQLIMLNLEVKQESASTIISAINTLALESELDQFEQKVLFYIMQCVTITLFNLKDPLYGVTLFGPRLLKLTLESILKSESFAFKNLIIFSEELHKIRRKTKYNLTDCKLYKLKYLLKFIESFELYKFKKLPDFKPILADNFQDKDEEYLCEVYFYAYILKIRFSGKDRKSFKLFEVCFKLLRESRKIKEHYNTFLYYLKNISKQLFITDRKAFSGIIKDIKRILDIIRGNNYYFKLIESYLNCLFYRCSEPGIIKSDFLSGKSFIISDFVNLSPETIYLTIKAKKFLFAKHLEFENIVPVKSCILEKYLELNYNVSTELQFFQLFFTLRKVEEYTRNSELNRLISLAYFDLLTYYDQIPYIGINIFIISKQFFENKSDYVKYLDHFNVNKKYDLDYFYKCKSEDELKNYLLKIPIIDELEIQKKIILSIFNSTWDNCRRAGDLFLQLSALSWLSLRLWQDYSDIYLTNYYQKEEKNSRKREFQKTFKYFLKFINFEQESINYENLEQFFQCLENNLKLYSLSRNKIMNKNLFSNECCLLLVYLPKFIFSNNFQRKEFALCENYLGRLKSFRGNSDFNKAISEEKRTFIDKVSSLYYYSHKNYEQCIEILYSYEYEYESGLLHKCYFLYPLFMSYKNLKKFKKAEDLLRKYIGKFTLISIIKGVNRVKDNILLLAIGHLHLCLVDIYLDLNEMKKALDILEFIMRMSETYQYQIKKSFRKNLQKFKIEKSYKKDYTTLVVIFNTTSLDTTELENHLQNGNLMQNDRSFVIKSSKFDQEQLKKFEKLEKLKYLDNLVIIVFTYSENVQAIMSKTNEKGKKIKSLEDIIRIYFHNNIFKGFQYLNKFFFFNIIDSKDNQSKEPNKQTSNEEDNHLSNEIDKLDINTNAIEIKLINKQDQNVHLNNTFLWETKYQNITHISIFKFIKIVGKHVFIDGDSSTNEQDINEKIHYFGWTGDNIFYKKLDQDNTNTSEIVSNECARDRLCIIISSSDLHCYLNKNPTGWRLGDCHDQIILIMEFIKLNYQVEIVKDKTSVEIKEYFENLANDDRLDKFNSIMLIILSHGGKDGYVFGSDCGKVSIKKDILTKLNQSKYLKDKEKVIIVNACRGDNKFFSQSIDSIEELNTDLIDYYCDQQELNMQLFCNDSNDQDGNAQVQISNEHEQFSNMLVCYSTQNDYVSFRDPDAGSWFITAFLESLLSYGKTYNLVDILIHTEKVLITEFPENQLIPKQSTEIILYNWNNDYFI